MKFTICIGMAMICGCQCVRKTTRSIARITVVGLWNGLTKDDVSLKYDCEDCEIYASDDYLEGSDSRDFDAKLWAANRLSLPPLRERGDDEMPRLQ